MQFPDTKLFRYRYDFEPKLLIDFIRERYLPSCPEQELREVLRSRVQVDGVAIDEQKVISSGEWIEYLHHRDDEPKLDLELSVLYEDERLLALSKPAFLPVAPSGRFFFNSLAILAREYFDNEELSPLHRLDIETSGVLLFGKKKRDRGKFQKLFERKKIDKRYQAVVFNQPNVDRIEGDIVPAEGSKIFTKQILVPSESPTSLTLIEKQEPWGDFTRVWMKPVTGKTNQLRVHLASLNCHIVGDKKYYPDERVYLDWFEFRDIKRILPELILSRQALHCESVSFICPFQKQELLIQDSTSTWEDTIQPLLSYQL